MTKHPVSELMFTLMVPDMKENGKRIYKMGLESKPGLMALNMKETIKMAKKMEKVF